MLMTITLSRDLGLQFHLNSPLAPQAVGKVIFNIARLHLEYSEGRQRKEIILRVIIVP